MSFFPRASCARAWSVNTRKNLIGLFLLALFSSFVVSQRKDFTRKTNLFALDVVLQRQRLFLAKLLKMGVTWSSYREKRKEKKELKRFARSFVVFSSCENEKDKRNRTCLREKEKLTREEV